MCVHATFVLYFYCQDQIIMYSSPLWIYSNIVTSTCLRFFNSGSSSLCLIIKHGYHIPQCGIFSDSFVGASVWLYALRTKMRWYEVWKLLDMFSDLIVTLGYFYWEHLGLILADLWYLNSGFQLVWFWEHLLYLHLGNVLKCCLAWKLITNLAHGKYH